MKLITPSEYQMQVAVADALRLACAPGWLWTHFPAGEWRHPVVGGKLQAMGLQRGWADLLLLDPIGKLHALELKTRRGVLSPDQEKFRDDLVARGLPYAVDRSVVEAVEQLTAWGALSKLRINA